MNFKVTRPDQTTYIVSIPEGVDYESTLQSVLKAGDTWTTLLDDTPEPEPEEVTKALSPRQFQWFCLAGPLGEAINVAAQNMLTDGLKAQRATYLLKGTERPFWTLSDVSTLASEVSDYLASKEVSMDLSPMALEPVFNEAFNV